MRCDPTPLRIRATRMRWLGNLILVIIPATIVGLLSNPHASGKDVALIVALDLGIAFLGIRFRGVRVCASADALVVRNLLWRYRIAWPDVTQIQVVRLALWSGQLWTRLLWPGVALTVHLGNGDEILLEATARERRARDLDRGEVGEPFGGWLTTLEGFRRGTADGRG